MRKQVAAEHPESQPEKKGKESQERTIPQRCKACKDLDYCDCDFCLHWWH